jgi:threonine synthase
MAAPRSCLTHLACARCRSEIEADRLVTQCACGGTYLARYDLGAAKASLSRGLAGRGPDLWRWAEVLPVRDPALRRGLGEGGTPLLPAARLGVRLGLPRLFLKDEGRNPGGSFKARGMAVAMARAVELGARRFALPSAGNAGGAAAAYGAAWGVEVHVALPKDTPEAFRREITGHGAQVLEVEGDIAEAGRRLAAHPDAARWFFLSTLREPYRVEGKKTMGYELIQALGGRWPDVVIYPTGGGTGLVGLAKADEECRALGLLTGPEPRYVSVQAEGCAPIVRAFREGKEHAEPWKNPQTTANGLRVPGSVGDHLMLEALRRSGGTAITVSDDEMGEARSWLARDEGLHAAPEAAATVAAARKLGQAGWLKPEERVVLFLTGDGFKYGTEAGTHAGS